LTFLLHRLDEAVSLAK